MIRFREFLQEQREYVNPENISQAWSQWKSKYKLKDNQIWHPNKPYSDYNAIWIDNSGKMITKFTITEGRYHKSDKSKRWKNPDFHEHLRLAIEDLKNGYVFDDNDRYLNPSDPYSKLDTCTHMLAAFSDKDKLVYSKCISLDPYSPVSHRLTYEVFKPEVINGVNTCKVVLNNFIEHRYDDEPYKVIDKMWKYEKRYNEIENS